MRHPVDVTSDGLPYGHGPIGAANVERIDLDPHETINSFSI